MTREEIVNEARQWVGCKWIHQACVRGVACDCVGLVRGVHAQLTGDAFVGDYDYPATWHLFKEDEKLCQECRKYLVEIPVAAAGAGDILLFGFRPRFPAHHLALLTGDGTIIHSYMDVGVVVETTYNEEWRSMVRFAFRYPEAM